MTEWKTFAALILTSALSGCLGGSGDVVLSPTDQALICAGRVPIYIREGDVLSQETAMEIIASNEGGENDGCWTAPGDDLAE